MLRFFRLKDFLARVLATLSFRQFDFSRLFCVDILLIQIRWPNVFIARQAEGETIGTHWTIVASLRIPSFTLFSRYASWSMFCLVYYLRPLVKAPLKIYSLRRHALYSPCFLPSRSKIQTVCIFTLRFSKYTIPTAWTATAR